MIFRKEVLYSILLIYLVSSCNKKYKQEEIDMILDNYLYNFLYKEEIDINNVKYKIEDNRYYNKRYNYYQYNKTYYQIIGKDTVSITCSFFTDDNSIKIIEIKNLKYWKTTKHLPLENLN